MKNSLFIFCITILLTSSLCQASDMSVHYHKVDRVTGAVAKELRKRYQMAGFGGGYLKIAFQMQKAATEEEARRLITECVSYYLDALNADPKLIEGNEGRPFVANDLGLEIYFRDLSGCHLLYPFVTVVSTSTGFVHYNYDYPEIQYPFGKTVSETYQEASQKVLQLLESNVARDVEFQKIAKQIITAAAAKVEGIQLEIEGIGLSGGCFAVRYRLYTTKNHQEARALVVKAADALVEEINASEPLRGYLTKKPFTRDNVEVGIHFIEATRRRGLGGFVYSPNIDSIALNNRGISYTFYDNSRHIRHQTTEPYETALSLLKGEESVDSISDFVSQLD